MGWIEHTKKLFGDSVVLVAYSEEEKKLKRVLKGAYKEALRLQKIFNFYDSWSELSKLNKKRKKLVSPELLEVLRFSLKLGKESSGAYDITQGRNFLRRKSGQKLKPLRCSYRDVHINGSEVTLLHGDVVIDLGSVAKGYITDKVGDFLKKEGINDFVIDARGDVLLSGIATPIVRIQHPRKPDEFICTLSPKDAGIATSGDYLQYGKTFDESHILGGRDYSSITVIAKTLMEADAYATLFSVAGKKLLKRILKDHKKVAVMTIDKKMNREYYNNFRLIASNV